MLNETFSVIFKHRALCPSRSSMNNIQAEPNSIENEEAGVTLASYNLTLGKWVCPKPDDPQEAQQTLPLPIDTVPNVRAVSLELCLLTF